MAGVQLEIVADTATPAVGQALAGLSGKDRTLMLSDIGEYLLRATRERQEQEIAPDGTPWAPLSPRYKKFKDKKRPGVKKLIFDFHMIGDQFAHQVEGDTVAVGTMAKYGATHQFGRDEIPARPWLGLSDEDEQEVLAIAHDHLAGLFAVRG